MRGHCANVGYPGPSLPRETRGHRGIRSGVQSRVSRDARRTQEKTDFSALSAFSAVIACSEGLGVDNGPQRF